MVARRRVTPVAIRDRANPRRSVSRRFLDSGDAESGLREDVVMGQGDFRPRNADLAILGRRQRGTRHHVSNPDICTGRVERTPSIGLPGEADSGGNPVIVPELWPIEVLPDRFANFQAGTGVGAGFEEVETE